MKLIPLTQGKFAHVDDEDYQHLIKLKWNALKSGDTFYARSKGKSMHRKILGLTDPKIKCDHIDHNGLNNQRDNLRVATYSQNNANTLSRKNSTSKYLGVSLKNQTVNGKTYTYWYAQIRKDKKNIYCRRFKNEIDAAKQYNKWASEIHGIFANLNYVIPSPGQQSELILEVS